ncbi:MAG: protein kinase domain-containing protein [Bacteroidota bacterium]
MDAIGKYQIREVIGRGGMGTVYRAHDTVIGRDVAIKVIADHVASIQSVKHRLYKEATSAGRLAHENIMTLYDIGEKDGRPYLVMELLEGRDLRRIFDGSEVLSFDEKMDAALQICRGLAYAHQRGVIHRDIKPENIRILPSGRVKILDFGIARVESETRTLTHSSIGTPRYMSPEQVRGEEIDHRTDIFSFGVLLYELLSGINPFDGSHVTAVIYRILHTQPEPLHVDDERLSADLQRIVSRCLEKEADRRYSDFPAVIGDLQDALSKRRADAPTLIDPSYSTVESDSGSFTTRSSSSGTGWSRLLTMLGRARDLPASDSTTPGDASVVDDEAPVERLSRRRSVALVAAPVLIAVLVGGYLLLRGASEGDRDPASPPPLAASLSEEEDLAPLREQALEMRHAMESEKAQAEEWADADDVRDLFSEALGHEQAASDAFEEETVAGYRRAMDAFEGARNAFRAAVAAGEEDEAALREQVERTRASMEQARRSIAERGADALVAETFARADEGRASGNTHFEQGDLAAAMQAFGRAEAAYRDAARTLERVAATEERRRIALQAKQATDERRSIAAQWGGAPENEVAFERAEELREEALRLADAGEYDDAASYFGRAEAIYARIEEPTTRGDPALASAARSQVSQVKGSISDEHHDHERFVAAAELEARAANAFAEGDYDDAAALYEQAVDLFSEVAALPPSRTREIEVTEAIMPLLQRFERSLEQKDASGLHSLHTFLGGYAVMFDIAEDISAEVEPTSIEIADRYATVSVNLDMRYRNRTQRMRTENQSVNLFWTLEETGDGVWQLRDITRP